MNKYLIVGLGNVGGEYAATRHNIGFDVVDAFAVKQQAIFVQDRLASVAKMKLPREAMPPKEELFAVLQPAVV